VQAGGGGGSTPWLAYSTAQRVVGLTSWPLECDPARSIGLIAHPGAIRSLVLSYDGRQLVTLGACCSEPWAATCDGATRACAAQPLGVLPFTTATSALQAMTAS
jgi:hypothetical protein